MPTESDAILLLVNSINSINTSIDNLTRIVMAQDKEVQELKAEVRKLNPPVPRLPVQ